jgi:hypothetical protein
MYEAFKTNIQTASVLNSSALSYTLCLVSCVILRKNRSQCRRAKLTGWSLPGDTACFLCGSKWNFKYQLPECKVQFINYETNKECHTIITPTKCTLLLLEAQDNTICTFCLIFCPCMFQTAWVIFRGLNASAWLKLLLITIY